MTILVPASIVRESHLAVRPLSISREGLLNLMLRRLFQRLRRSQLVSPREYEKNLARYRRRHPESIEQEREQIQKWIAVVAATQREKQQDPRENRSYEEQARLAQALYELRETARAAFMRHPAATEYDFRRCWPSIREEMLKQHALEELAADPALSVTLATQATDARATLVATSEAHSPNLQLLKRSAQSD